MSNRAINFRSTARDRLVATASKLISKEILEGRLAKQSDCICVDCGVQAECYDHRDYREPLKVEPVCKGCNNRRGPGLPLPTKDDGAHVKITWLEKSSGKAWSGVESAGEGYDPNQCVLNGVTTQDIDNALTAERERESFLLQLERQETQLYRFHPIQIGRGSSGGGGFINLKDIKRCRYFKEHDPWFSPFF